MKLIKQKLLFLLWCLSSTLSQEPWIGSALGSNEYNKEPELIVSAFFDYTKALLESKIMPRKDLLCVVFVTAEDPLSNNIIFNVNRMGSSCDWALVMYDGNNKTASSNVCNHAVFKNKLVLCERSVDITQSYNKIIKGQKQKTSIPKTVLYQTLLPVLSSYSHVFLMDEDISLAGFDYQFYREIWQCALYPRPLITQPLIAESTQYLAYVNEKPWRQPPWSEVIASTVGYVEQQVPMFDSVFFEWFVRRVLTHTRKFSLELGIDWGHDRSWCNAAQMYARFVLRWPASAKPCALVTAPNTSVHHLNKKTMKIIRGNPTEYRRNAFQIVQKYVDLFPTWVEMNMRAPNNPFEEKNRKKFTQIRGQLDANCTKLLKRQLLQHQ